MRFAPWIAVVALVAGCASQQEPNSPAAEVRPAPITREEDRPVPWIHEHPPLPRCPTCGQPTVQPPSIFIPPTFDPPEPAPEPLSDADALHRASVGGKYTKLLRTLDVPGDFVAYGEFRDWGRWEGTSYAGFDDLPPGNWVYVYPRWYVWE